MTVPGSGWISLASLGADGGREERHRRIEAEAGPGAPSRLAEAWEVEAVSWFAGELVARSLIRREGLPVARPDRCWVRIGGAGLAEELAVDPSAPTVEARVPLARRVLTGLLAPLIGPARRTSARVLWWHAGDRVAEATLWCGAESGEQEAALAIAGELVAPGVPYSVPLGAEAAGEVRRRRTCCLSYRTAGGETCPGCPRRRER